LVLEVGVEIVLGQSGRVEVRVRLR